MIDQQGFKKVLVDFSPIDDVSSVLVNPKLMEEFNCSQSDALLIMKKNRYIYCSIIEDDSIPIQKIGINKQITSNVHVKLSDYVRVKPVKLSYLSKISIAPLSGSNVKGDFFNPYLKPHFLDNYRPVHKGLSFKVTGQMCSVNFKVVDIEFPIDSSEIPSSNFSFQTDQNQENQNFQGNSISHPTDQKKITNGGIVSNRTEIIVLPEVESDENLDFIGYADIGGQDRALKQIREAVELTLRYPEIFNNLGIKAPSGVLLFGPPGTGKTLIARAVSNETGSFFFLINGPEIMSKMSGESEANLRRAFDEAVKNAPSIIFIDEIDSIAPKRDKTAGDVDKRVVSMLLTLMDGVKKRKRVLVLAATNRQNSLDPALRRFGRFDREIEIGIPTEEGRLQTLKIHTKNMKLAEDVELEELARLSHGMVGADLAQLCTEAAFNCVRKKMDMIDFEEETVDAAVLDSMAVSLQDFKDALKTVDPAALRETAIESPNVHWEEIGGLNDIKEALREMVEYPLIYPSIFSAYGQPPSRGCLLWGPPGCGKTMLAKAIATECEANFISVKGPELLTMWVGESEANVRDVFNKARAASPCIIFFDEIDSLAHARGSNAGDSGVGDRVMNSILLEMDGINPSKQIFVIGATNRPDILDPALTRPGRLDSMIYVGLPNKETRKEVLKVSLKKCPLEESINFDELANLTEGYSSADISGLSKTAAKISIKKALMKIKRQGSEKEDIFKDGYPPISKENLLRAIKATKSSVSLGQIQQYLSLKSKYTSGYVGEGNGQQEEEEGVQAFLKGENGDVK